MIPQVIQILKEIEEIHSKKNDDYAANNQPFENFTRASELISWFNNNQDKAFVNHIATKLARISTLLNNGKEPNNESLNDSFKDLCTYCILWYAFHLARTSCENQLKSIVQSYPLGGKIMQEINTPNKVYTNK